MGQSKKPNEILNEFLEKEMNRNVISQGCSFTSKCRKGLRGESGHSNLGLPAKDKCTLICSSPFLTEYAPFKS